MNDFKTLQEFVNECNSSNSTSSKLEVVKKYSSNGFILNVFLYTYSPFKQFGVSSKNCIKNKSLIATTNNYDNLFNLLDDLHERIITGHDAIKAINAFVKANSEYAAIIYNILDKDLKTRVGTTLINRIIPNCIPEFKVALAHKYDASTKKRVTWSDGWYASRKLDGNRCIIIVDENGTAIVKSRSGKAIDTLQKVLTDIEALNIKSVVFDGEICIINENGSDNFNGLMTEIRDKNHTIQEPRYKIFDMISIEDFLAMEGERSLSDRQNDLKAAMQCYSGKILEIVEQTLVHSEQDLETWTTLAADSGWEGIMIRKNCGYKADRTYDLLKVKQFIDAEYIVTGVENGIFRVINNGVEIEEEVLSNVTILHKGYTVSVGSGFSLEERRRYYKHPELIIGKEITVKYFEETKNGSGGISLRFPTVKNIWEQGSRSDVE